MSFSENYAECYDALYQDKSYTDEIVTIKKLIQNYCSDAQTLIDYGCGTGNHARLLLQQGYHVYGIDRSPAMLAIARQKLQAFPQAHLLQADQRETLPTASIDVGLTLFDVVSYLTTNQELNDYLAFFRRVLKPKGLLIFDCWHGPGVLHLRPEKRWKEVTHAGKMVLRLTDPVLDETNCLIKIVYQILVEDAHAGIRRFEDTHYMRYFFEPELELLLAYHGFDLLQCGTWRHPEGPPTTEDWSILLVCQRNR